MARAVAPIPVRHHDSQVRSAASQVRLEASGAPVGVSDLVSIGQAEQRLGAWSSSFMDDASLRRPSLGRGRQREHERERAEEHERAEPEDKDPQP